MPVCSLVDHETNAQCHDDAAVVAPSLCANELAETFRHSGWTAVRTKVADSIRRVAGFGPRLARFNRCGSMPWIIRNIADPDVLALAGDACRDRFCLPCAQWRSTRIAKALRDHTVNRPLLFMTLTLADAFEHTDGRIASVAPCPKDAAGWTRIPLRVLLAKLYKAFSALRRCDFWRKEVVGGAAFLELKWQPRKQRWHPHLHLMVEARFVPQDRMRAAWLRITKTSHRIDIQKIRDRENAIGECCKYASKPVTHSYADDAKLLDEAVDALKSRRFCNAFGSWRGLKLSGCDDPVGWERVAPLASIIAQAERGNPEAIVMLERLGISIPEQRPPPAVDFAPEQLRMWATSAPGLQWRAA